MHWYIVQMVIFVNEICPTNRQVTDETTQYYVMLISQRGRLLVATVDVSWGVIERER